MRARELKLTRHRVARWPIVTKTLLISFGRFWPIARLFSTMGNRAARIRLFFRRLPFGPPRRAGATTLESKAALESEGETSVHPLRTLFACRPTGRPAG